MKYRDRGHRHLNFEKIFNLFHSLLNLLLTYLQSKGSSDRRGWSFRKKSAGHRVLSNSVTSEAPASASKESQESISVSCQVQPDLTVAEKTTEIQPKEEKKTELSSFLDSKLSDTQASIEDTFGEDASPDEPSIILIQTAIRGFLVCDHVWVINTF